MSKKPADAASADLPLPHADRPIASAPGHWVLARAGKRVLRPGGAALSAAMLGHAHLADADVVELAPGLGRTAAEIIKDHPASYTAIDRDPDAARRVAAVVGNLGSVRQGEAADTGLDDASDDVVGVIRAGARGYVTKAISTADLAQAVRRVAAGDAAFSPRLAGFVLDAFGAGTGEVAVADTELDRLSAREREVMRLIARGYTYRECAGELFISIKTVETHVSAVLRKLQLSNRNELTRWAVARRIV